MIKNIAEVCGDISSGIEDTEVRSCYVVTFTATLRAVDVLMMIVDGDGGGVVDGDDWC